MTCDPIAGVPGRPVRAPGSQWRDPDGLHIEVRGLEPPGPLVAILRLVESHAGDVPVFVHHDRDPQLLYPELAERGWTAQRVDGDPGEVRLKLERERAG